jgi:Spore germination B3/ GerAC like, C-terminal
MGTAVFNRGQMVDKLTGNETIAMSILRGEFTQTFVMLPDPEVPGKFIQVNLNRVKKPKITIEQHGRDYFAKVQVNLNADIAEIQANKSYELPKYLPLLEHAIGQWVRHQCLIVFNKAQKDGADVFGFGKYARWLVPDWPAWQALDWNSAFLKMDLRLTVTVHVNRTGLIYNKMAIQEGK